MSVRFAFTTFGMFIIDEIEFTEGQQPQQNLIGGAGVYAALGARLVAGLDHASSVTWIVDVGSDFPPEFRNSIEQWHTACVFRLDSSRLTTRAWNGYGPNEHRSFKYLTPKVRLEVDSLSDEQAQSASFHMVCSSSRSLDLSTSLRARRKEIDSSIPDPIIVWEPIPDLCTPEELDKLQLAAAHVRVVSPNAEEMMDFFPAFAISTQDEMVPIFIGWNHGRCLETYVIIREGAGGSSVYFPPKSGDVGNSRQSVNKLHLPAYHTATTAHKVVDPTGGGNTYLGGLAIGMTDSLDKSHVVKAIQRAFPRAKKTERDGVRDSCVIIGAICAVIAASFAIEQCGIPKLTRVSEENASHSVESWNGDAFEARLQTYIERERLYIDGQLQYS